MSQANKTLEALKEKPSGLTTRDLFYRAGTLRASARIKDLRLRGHKIAVDVDYDPHLKKNIYTYRLVKGNH